ncbi:hypothetical protein JS578_06860 [Dysgonomonadaceae bacterium zrk40]|nr:hypothetical protein JS578_06860 [Dysgonomonadaceae bacterium zrk40]
MREKKIPTFTVLMIVFCVFGNLNAQDTAGEKDVLSLKQKSLIPIAAYTAIGDLHQLKTAL